MAEFKERLQELRESADMSKKQLADVLRVSKASVGYWESGQRMPARSTLEAIADYFNVDMDYLCGRDEKSTYYINPQAAQVAQKIFEDKNLRALFDAAKDVPPEVVQSAAELLKRFKETNPNG